MAPPPAVAWGRMTRDVLIVALIGVAVLAYRFPLFAGSLYVPSPVCNFNVATAGDEVNARFIARNLHPWPVTLTKVKGSCGCTRPIAARPLPAPVASVPIACLTAFGRAS